MTRLIIAALLLAGCASAQQVEDTAERECFFICSKPTKADCEQVSAFQWNCVCRCDGPPRARERADG